MGIHFIDDYIGQKASQVLFPVDLVKIAKTHASSNPGEKIKIVLDAEGCMDRLYGGFFSDWVCGGQWNRMTHFLTHLVQACQAENIELSVFFNGALERDKLSLWHKQQMKQRGKVSNIMRHLNQRASAPPKVWWSAPNSMATCLKYALLHLQVPIHVSMDDHHQEVIAHCREEKCHGLMAQSPVYVIFVPPRYFSSQKIKLTYKGALETEEYSMDMLATALQIQRGHFPILAALLGNHILTEEELEPFYAQLKLEKEKGAYKSAEVIDAVVGYLKKLSSISDLNELGNVVFRGMPDAAALAAKFRKSVHYYLNGTADGFLKYYPRFGAGADSKDKMATDDDEMNGGVMPRASPEMIRTASERHGKGMMHPWIYQVLTQGDIKVELSLEDEHAFDLPSAHLLYRPIRQHVYAILFDVKKDQRTTVQVKEWYFTKAEEPTADDVAAKGLEWEVPPLKTLWLGTEAEDKNKRLRAYLSCMSSDTPLMLNTQYVPQHYLIMCTVLRYMIAFKDKPTLRRMELDAFLSQAVSSRLHDVNAVSNMQLPMYVPRGVQLGALFMAGVENAVFANDACGAPIPWSVACPWLYFDGKLFQAKLLRAVNGASLIELCDGEVEQVMRVERMRQAIMEGLRWEQKMFMPQQAAGAAVAGLGGGVGGAVPSLVDTPFPAIAFAASAYGPGMGRGFMGGPMRARGRGRGFGRRGGRGRGRPTKEAAAGDVKKEEAGATAAAAEVNGTGRGITVEGGEEK